MAGATGLEPATSGVTGRRSNQLSYAPATVDRGDTSYLGAPGVSSNPRPLRGAEELLRSPRALVGDEGFEPPTPSV